MRKMNFCTMLMVLLLVASVASYAAVPQTISYQGYLKNTNGTPVGIATTVRFSLYSSSPARNNPVWWESKSVTPANGVYSTQLGSVIPITVPFNVPYHLGVKVESDPEMPLQPLGSVPYALRTAVADGVTTSATMPISQLTGTLATSQLADGAVTAAKLGGNGCTAGQIMQWNGTTWTCSMASAALQGAVTGNLTVSGKLGVGTTATPLETLSVGGMNSAIELGADVAGKEPNAGKIFYQRFGNNDSLEIVGAGTVASNRKIRFFTEGGATFEGSISSTGNLTLQPSTSASVGNVMKGTTPFVHNYGTNSTFVGENAGNFSMTGGYNTATGSLALNKNTEGFQNTATGQGALQNNKTGSYNTATGQGALQNNDSGSYNTADGLYALISNTTGWYNTAIGEGTLQLNTTGTDNTAVGQSSLLVNKSGSSNSAVGKGSLQNNLASFNTAIGADALLNNSEGSSNVAAGNNSLVTNVTGNGNTAIVYGALRYNYSGSWNIAIGNNAGQFSTGSRNINIGHDGVAGESDTIRIGYLNTTATYIAGIHGKPYPTLGSTAPVYVGFDGSLGTMASSKRFKDDVVDMGEASSLLMKLRPVTFHYKSDQNPKGRTLQYGLIAEEVLEVAPELIAYTADGEIYTVMYQHLPPMLLNEYQKQQRSLEQQKNDLAALKSDNDLLKTENSDMKVRLERLERLFSEITR